MKIAIIGNGAISQFVQRALSNLGPEHDIEVAAIIVRKKAEELSGDGIAYLSSLSDLVSGQDSGIDLLVDCAGHEALEMHGLPALAAGIDVLTVSIGALSDEGLVQALESAATKGNAKLHLVSGAIGALDALRAARIGPMAYVKYTGRKPPKGWLGSPAEKILNLETISQAETHFIGSARDAAMRYPKNANVAAAVALSSMGLDKTEVELIADPTISSNMHQIEAKGDFGELHFTIAGNSLPDNPRSSALAAMNIVDAIVAYNQRITFR